MQLGLARLAELSQASGLPLPDEPALRALAPPSSAYWPVTSRKR